MMNDKRLPRKGGLNSVCFFASFSLLGAIIPGILWANVTLRAERSDPRVEEQMALSIADSPSARLTLNSNFLLGSAAQVELGYFEVDLEKVYPGKWKALAHELKALEKTKSNLPSRPIPHATRLFIGGTEFTEDSPTGQLILKTLRTVWAHQTARKPRDTALATLQKGPHSSIRILYHGRNAQTQPVTAPCRPSGKDTWSCEVTGYGMGDFK